MGKPANKTLIGAFVAGALILAVVGVALFGSGRFLSKRPKHVMFFSGSVDGLTVGSPVMFRGVKVGEVTEIRAFFNPRDMSVVIPVYTEYFPGSLTVTDEAMGMMSSLRGPFINRMVEKGFKAQLRTKSIITGQLYIAVDFFPEKPLRVVGMVNKYPEIPTIPSRADEMMATLQRLPVVQITDRLLKISEGMDRTVNSPELAESLKNLSALLIDVKRVVRNLDAEIQPMAANVSDTSAAARNAFQQAEKTLAMKEGEAGKIAGKIQETLVKVGGTLEDIRTTFSSYNDFAENNAHMGEELAGSLREIEKAAASIRSLTDYLEQHPESLLKGKKSADGE